MKRKAAHRAGSSSLIDQYVEKDMSSTKRMMFLFQLLPLFISSSSVPCGASNGTICEKASKLETNGTAFCEAVGFSVVDDSSEEPCYGSKSILVTVVPVVESLTKTVRLQEHKVKLLLLNLQISCITSVIALAGTLMNRLDYQIERGARRLRRRNRRNKRRF
ncbi:unnamed protein product [Eruca vesicaria subsp. sativa]|uniref:Uncharacterized protein n=1 Tax=Eruca vesicaria subsp. sativa TaxID=29727 RepID=A0ABC8LRL7_ERUVS|nr:unnamed protein product [Eruca vesicaria subsp. sativa]